MRLVNKNFLAQPRSVIAATKNYQKATDDTLAPCRCLSRSPCPPVPHIFPLPPRLNIVKSWKNELNVILPTAFNTCIHQKLQAVIGEQFSIQFLHDFQPFAVCKHIPVPHHRKEGVKSQLDSDVALNIIEAVTAGTPTTRCSRMITVAKEDKNTRRTADLQNLNAATRQETHHTPSPFSFVSTVPPRMKKAVLDAWNGYHNVLLCKLKKRFSKFSRNCYVAE